MSRLQSGYRVPERLRVSVLALLGCYSAVATEVGASECKRNVNRCQTRRSDGPRI